MSYSYLSHYWDQITLFTRRKASAFAVLVNSEKGHHLNVGVSGKLFGLAIHTRLPLPVLAYAAFGVLVRPRPPRLGSRHGLQTTIGGSRDFPPPGH
jgi:hypothetical protein